MTSFVAQYLFRDMNSESCRNKAHFFSFVEARKTASLDAAGQQLLKKSFATVSNRIKRRFHRIGHQAFSEIRSAANLFRDLIILPLKLTDQLIDYHAEQMNLACKLLNDGR